jgi:GxxExxY protein
MINTNILYKGLSHTIIGIAMRVHTRLGAGLPEHCYSRAMAIEFNDNHIPYSREFKVIVHYNDEPVGHLIPDIVVDSKIILELKSDNSIYPYHISQLFSYLHATKLRVGYVLNFGHKSLQFKRVIV